MLPLDAAVPLAPWVAFLQPYVDLLVPPIVMGLVGWVAIRIQQWFGIKMQSDAVERLKSAAATSAGALVAGAEGNLATRSINVRSPEVARIANEVARIMPDSFKAAGATPEGLQRIVVGEIGKLQASAAPVVVTPGKGT